MGRSAYGGRMPTAAWMYVLLACAMAVVAGWVTDSVAVGIISGLVCGVLIAVLHAAHYLSVLVKQQR